MRGAAREHHARTQEAPRSRGEGDSHLRIALLCTAVAWLLAMARFCVALLRHEHGVDAALAAALSAALPGLAAAGAASVFLRRRRRSGGRDNVVALRTRRKL